MKIKVLIKTVLLVLISSNITPLKANETKVTEVVVISAMHGMHKGHPSYDYETLYSLVKSYNPDFVGVEIRNEDIGLDADYLNSNYPNEMVVLANQYEKNVFGFDWLGSEIQGKPIPAQYWKNLEVKKIEKQLSNDEAFLKSKPKRLNAISKEMGTILKYATPSSLNDGQLGQLRREKVKLWQQWTKGTIYQKIFEFNNLRDKRIGENITSIISKNRGSRIVFVMGAAHRTYAVENIKKNFKDKVVFLPIKM